MLVIEPRGDTERQARSIRALVMLGILRDFPMRVEDGLDPYLCYCLLESELLAYCARNRWAGVTEGWRFCVGLADEGVADVPVWTDWGEVQCWVEYQGAIITVELVEIPGCDVDDSLTESVEEFACACSGVCRLGVVVSPREEFFDCHDARTLVKAAFSETSAMRLNGHFRPVRALEEQFKAEEVQHGG